MVATRGKQQTQFLGQRMILWAIPLFLFAFGVLEIFTASRFKGIELKNNEFYFAIIHFFWVVLAIFIAFASSWVSSGIWKKLSTVLYYVTLALLIGVLFTPAVNGARRWFPIVEGINLQPSEFAKITVVIYGAYLIETFASSSYRTYQEHLQRFLFPVMGRLGILMLLVAIQPDLGTAVVMFVAFFLMYTIKGTKYVRQDFMLLVGIGIVGIIGFSLVKSYRIDRIQTYVSLITTGKIYDEFGTGYQLRNILIGVGSGGLWGKGIGQSRQRFGYLVETTAFTDSISAVIFEELGFFLGVIFLSVYLVYFLTISHFAQRQKNEYKKLVMWGLAGWFMSQTFLHLAANLALIPVKGIPLPFITYGGSSILSIAVAAGIIYSFSLDKGEERPNKK